MNRVQTIPVAGAVSSAAYLADQAIDIAATGKDPDDRVLVGAHLPVNRADARPCTSSAASSSWWSTK